ncbi:hypothetical protein [Streptomyces sp. NPDC059459]|uniref:hypothetical protein n=1 Tax=unclassified Streptomyces TaxID=2593676 RepID=UPI0036C1850C
MAIKRSLAASGAVALLVLGTLGVQQGLRSGGGTPHDGVSAAAARPGTGHGYEALTPAVRQPLNTPWT